MEFLGVSKTHFPQSNNELGLQAIINNIYELMKLVLSYEVQITYPEFWLYGCKKWHKNAYILCSIAVAYNSRKIDGGTATQAHHYSFADVF